jgi:hypothetical protein
MTHKPPPTPEELILAILRDVLTRQAEAMGLPVEPKRKSLGEAPPAPTPTPPPATPPEPPVTREAILERLRTRVAADPSIRAGEPAEAAGPPSSSPPRLMPTASAPKPVVAPVVPSATSRPTEMAEGEEPLSQQEAAEFAEFEALAAQPLAPGGFTRAVRWSMAAILLVLVLASLPFFEGQSLFRVQSEAENIVLRDGLLLKGSGNAVYVMRGETRRLISSIDAFEHYGYRWSAITEVGDDFLAQVPERPPINVLLTWQGIQEIYLLTGTEKRLVSDLEALKAEGYTLDGDLRTIPCNRLRSISDGLAYP